MLLLVYPRRGTSTVSFFGVALVVCDCGCDWREVANGKKRRVQAEPQLRFEWRGTGQRKREGGEGGRRGASTVAESPQSSTGDAASLRI